MTTTPLKVLFICTGNTCRSVMGEFLLNKLSKDRGLGWTARSCGVAAERYFQVPPGIRAALKAEGIDEVSHVAQLVTRELLGWCDVALAMTREHYEELSDHYPEYRQRLKVFKPHCGVEGSENVEDPIGQSDRVYAACCKEIREALESLIKKHGPYPQDPRP
ncbi:MAG: low molecular weight protein arginine phosphatase [Elusimicrobiota bacterium]